MLFQTVVFKDILDFQKHCKNSPESSHIPFPQLPLKLTSYIITAHLLKPSKPRYSAVNSEPMWISQAFLPLMFLASSQPRTPRRHTMHVLLPPQSRWTHRFFHGACPSLPACSAASYSLRLRRSGPFPRSPRPGRAGAPWSLPQPRTQYWQLGAEVGRVTPARRRLCLCPCYILTARLRDWQRV